jgi:hypothetical protein
MCAQVCCPILNTNQYLGSMLVPQQIPAVSPVSSLLSLPSRRTQRPMMIRRHPSLSPPPAYSKRAAAVHAPAPNTPSTPGTPLTRPRSGRHKDTVALETLIATPPETPPELATLTPCTP